MGTELKANSCPLNPPTYSPSKSNSASLYSPDLGRCCGGKQGKTILKALSTSLVHSRVKKLTFTENRVPYREELQWEELEGV